VSRDTSTGCSVYNHQLYHLLISPDGSVQWLLGAGRPVARALEIVSLHSYIPIGEVESCYQNHHHHHHHHRRGDGTEEPAYVPLRKAA
jgi:hypothetical protein